MSNIVKKINNKRCHKCGRYMARGIPDRDAPFAFVEFSCHRCDVHEVHLTCCVCWSIDVKARRWGLFKLVKCRNCDTWIGDGKATYMGDPCNPADFSYMCTSVRIGPDGPIERHARPFDDSLFSQPLAPRLPEV